jgi:hypothetical protein
VKKILGKDERSLAELHTIGMDATIPKHASPERPRSHKFKEWLRKSSNADSSTTAAGGKRFSFRSNRVAAYDEGHTPHVSSVHELVDMPSSSAVDFKHSGKRSSSEDKDNDGKVAPVHRLVQLPQGRSQSLPGAPSLLPGEVTDLIELDSKGSLPVQRHSLRTSDGIVLPSSAAGKRGSRGWNGFSSPIAPPTPSPGISDGGFDAMPAVMSIVSKRATPTQTVPPLSSSLPPRCENIREIPSVPASCLRNVPSFEVHEFDDGENGSRRPYSLSGSRAMIGVSASPAPGASSAFQAVSRDMDDIEAAPPSMLHKSGSNSALHGGGIVGTRDTKRRQPPRHSRDAPVVPV